MKPIRIYLLTIFCIIIGNNGMSQTQVNAKLEASIRSIMKADHIPGVIITVVGKDTVYWKKEIGYANLANKTAVSAPNLFKIGSVTKTFIALAIMKLVEEKKISLYTKLSDISPEVPFSNAWEKTNPIRICDLLEHKAGFDDMHFSALTDRSGQTKRITAWHEVIAHKNSLVSRWQPGLVHSYSNPGYVILGYIIEKITKQPYQDYIKKEILAPLGMSHTGFLNEISEKEEKDMAQGYSWYNEQFNPTPPFRFVGESAGAMFTNINDMQKFVQFFVRNGKTEAALESFEPEIEEMEHVHGWYEMQNKITNGYDLGLYSWSMGNQHKFSFMGHSGGIWGFGTDFIYNRKLDLGIAVSNNGETGNRKILNLLVDHFTNRKATSSNASLPIGTFSDWKGEYVLLNSRNKITRFIDILTSTVSVKLQHDSLSLTAPFSQEISFSRIKNNAFQKKDNAYPNLFLTQYQGEHIVYYDNDFYEPVNSFLLFLLRGFVVLSLIAGILAMLTMVANVILLIIKKTSKQGMISSLFFALPYLLTIVFLCLFLSLLQLRHVASAGEINLKTVTVFLISLLSPFFALLNVFILYKRWPAIKNRIAKYSYAYQTIGAILLTFYLAYNGIFAIATWNY